MADEAKDSKDFQKSLEEESPRITKLREEGWKTCRELSSEGYTTSDGRSSMGAIQDTVERFREDKINIVLNTLAVPSQDPLWGEDTPHRQLMYDKACELVMDHLATEDQTKEEDFDHLISPEGLKLALREGYLARERAVETPKASDQLRAGRPESKSIAPDGDHVRDRGGRVRD